MTTFKKGTLLTIYNKRIHYRSPYWGNRIEDDYGEPPVRKCKSWGIVTFKGEKWVQFESPDYSMSTPWMARISEIQTEPVKKEIVKKVIEKERFENSFGVNGKLSLLKAFAEEAVKAGWKQQKAPIINGLLYFNAQANNILPNLQKGHFWGINRCTTIQYSLPQQWDLAIQAMTEKVRNIPEYIECISLGGNTTDEESGFVKGRIYKTNLETSTVDCYCVDQDSDGEPNGWNSSNFKPSTGKKFLEQPPLFVPIINLGLFDVRVEKIQGDRYGTQNVISIGCKESGQFYSKASLETIKEVMCEKEVVHSQGVKFTKEIIDNLIKQIKYANKVC